MTELRVFLADDHAIVREGLKALINAQSGIMVVGEAADGLSACEQVPALQPDVVVMDMCMPGLTGSEATKRLRKECPLVKVLALTIHEGKGYIRQILAAGATGYVLKRAAPEELIHAIQVVAAGEVYLDPTMAGIVVGDFIRQRSINASLFGGVLSDREAEIVQLVATGFSNKEIAVRTELSVKTVETYRARGMEKLGLQTRVDVVCYAVQQGWLKDG